MSILTLRHWGNFLSVIPLWSMLKTRAAQNTDRAISTKLRQKNLPVENQAFVSYWFIYSFTSMITIIWSKQLFESDLLLVLMFQSEERSQPESAVERSSSEICSALKQIIRVSWVNYCMEWPHIERASKLIQIRI